MAKRTRRPTVAWLPCFPAPVIGNSPNSNFASFQLNPGQGVANQDGVTGIAFLTLDSPPESQGGSGRDMANFEGSGYRLRRIVGKCFAEFLPDGRDTAATAAIVTAGFIVLRVNSDTGIPLNADLNGYSPQLFGAERDPWIWRRSWILANKTPPTGQDLNNGSTFPSNNAGYGSVADGPHIDQKTARTVKTEERLVFVASAFCIGDLVGAADDDPAIQITLDYRLLGSPMRVMGNRGNASR